MRHKIKCRLCGKYFKQVNNAHLMYKHGFTPAEYKEEYRLKYVTSDELRSVISENLIGNKSFAGRKHKNKSIEKMRTKPTVSSPESRLNISKSLLGNKRAVGLKHTKEFKKRISLINKGKRYALGTVHTTEWKRVKSEQMKKFWKKKIGNSS